MARITRRKVLGSMARLILALLMSTPVLSASDRFQVDHPLVPPSKEFSGQCPLCGMARSMWARTWMEFNETDGVSEVCSFHCLADLTVKAGVAPKNIRLAVYHAPQATVDSGSATIVIGSSAKGTMSPKSKIVFADVQEAKTFTKIHGGEIASFRTALNTACTDLAGKNDMLVKKRLKKGKIIEPGAADRCTVCEMYPSRYPRNKCQIQTSDRTIHHFCSTQCLFTLLKKPEEYLKSEFKLQLIWVVDYLSGKWISGRAAYYIVGAKDVYGPMGFEAFPFYKKSDAESFVRNSGGNILLFGQVTVAKIFNP